MLVLMLWLVMMMMTAGLRWLPSIVGLGWNTCARGRCRRLQQSGCRGRGKDCISGVGFGLIFTIRALLGGVHQNPLQRVHHLGLVGAEPIEMMIFDEFVVQQGRRALEHKREGHFDEAPPIDACDGVRQARRLAPDIVRYDDSLE